MTKASIKVANIKFEQLLKDIYKGSTDDFSGIGLILYKDKAKIPTFPLSIENPNLPKENLVEALINISKLSSKFHDGFHLISSDFKLTDISQYFSPPIVGEVFVDRSKVFGGRYMAALFGSLIEGVELTGIATATNGIVIFQKGVEVYPQGDEC